MNDMNHVNDRPTISSKQKNLTKKSQIVCITGYCWSFMSGNAIKLPVTHKLPIIAWKYFLIFTRCQPLLFCNRLKLCSEFSTPCIQPIK